MAEYVGSCRAVSGRSGELREENCLIWRSRRKIHFVVEVLIDASGSQRDRTSRVALQGYILE